MLENYHTGDILKVKKSKAFAYNDHTNYETIRQKYGSSRVKSGDKSHTLSKLIARSLRTNEDSEYYIYVKRGEDGSWSEKKKAVISSLAKHSGAYGWLLKCCSDRQLVDICLN